MHFARNPASVRTGDLLVYYAAVYQRLQGIVEVFSRPEFDAQRGRLPYFCAVRPRLVIKDIGRAPSIDVLNVSGGRDFRMTVQQMDYAVLEEAEYEQALAALESSYDEARGDIRDSLFNRWR